MVTSKEFYTELTPEKFAKRKSKAHTRKELSYLKRNFLSKGQRILDLACGYGQFTIPLTKQGYDIEGIDITPVLIKKAKDDARKERVKVKFRLGNMLKLPYKENSFNVILCMWSAFVELTKDSDQKKAIKEMIRVLDKGGFALLEIPKPNRSTKDFAKKGDIKIIKSKGNILYDVIDNVEAMPMYRHDKKTLTNLIKKIKVEKYKVFTDDFGGRERLFLWFQK